MEENRKDFISPRLGQKENETETKEKIRDTLIITNILARREHWKLRNSDG